MNFNGFARRDGDKKKYPALNCTPLKTFLLLLLHSEIPLGFRPGQARNSAAFDHCWNQWGSDVARNCTVHYFLSVIKWACRHAYALKQVINSNCFFIWYKPPWSLKVGQSNSVQLQQILTSTILAVNETLRCLGTLGWNQSDGCRQHFRIHVCYLLVFVCCLSLTRVERVERIFL